jgi:hypothetical protein
MEFEALSIDEKQGPVVDVIIRAYCLFAVVLQVGLESLELRWHNLDYLVGGKPI